MAAVRWTIRPAAHQSPFPATVRARHHGRSSTAYLTTLLARRPSTAPLAREPFALGTARLQRTADVLHDTMLVP